MRLISGCCFITVNRGLDLSVPDGFPALVLEVVMAVQEFEIEVSGQRAFVYKENSFAPDDPYKFYLPFVRGQGCWTVWFGSLAAAKRALLKEHDGVKTGMDFADCRKCDCGTAACRG